MSDATRSPFDHALLRAGLRRARRRLRAMRHNAEDAIARARRTL